MTSSVVNNVVKGMKRATKVREKVNHIYFVLDASSSMDRLQDKVIESFNNTLKTVREEAKASKQKTYVSFLRFADTVVPIYENLLNGRNLTSSDYIVYGNTALHDGVGSAIKSLESLGVGLNTDVSYLVVTITDGMENQSQYYKTNQYGSTFGTSKPSLINIIKAKQDEGNWTFAFQGPPGSAGKTAREFGIPKDNIIEWDQTVKGVQEAETKTSGGIKAYYSGRSRGLASSEKFYTDLSHMSPKQVFQKLDDVSNKYKVYEVTQEEAIKEFVERKTRKPYVVGSAAYQLTKPEVVQASKELLLQEKGKKAVWGGGTRELLKIPTGKSVKVIPGNHSSWDLYCFSTSVNRKLVRGTKVLVDVTKTKPDKETWDSSTVNK